MKTTQVNLQWIRNFQKGKKKVKDVKEVAAEAPPTEEIDGRVAKAIDKAEVRTYKENTNFEEQENNAEDLQALKKLKHTFNGKKEKMTAGPKLKFDQLTEDSMELMDNGTDVAEKILILGSTRACTLAGNGKVMRKIALQIDERLDEAEKANAELDTVQQSADSVPWYFRGKGNKVHVEMLVARWDNVHKEGNPVVWDANHSTSVPVEDHIATGSGRVFTYRILEKHKVTMNEDETVEIVEKAILEGAQCDWKTDGGLDVLVLKNGQFRWKSQLMSEVAEKYKVPVRDLLQAPDPK